jgi:hypothetical protein
MKRTLPLTRSHVDERLFCGVDSDRSDRCTKQFFRSAADKFHYRAPPRPAKLWSPPVGALLRFPPRTFCQTRYSGFPVSGVPPAGPGACLLSRPIMPFVVRSTFRHPRHRCALFSSLHFIDRRTELPDHSNRMSESPATTLFASRCTPLGCSREPDR